MADYLTTDTELTSIANAIRTKGGTSAQLSYPSGFVSAINAIDTGGGGGGIPTCTMTVTNDPDVVLSNFSDGAPSGSFVAIATWNEVNGCKSPLIFVGHGDYSLSDAESSSGAFFVHDSAAPGVNGATSSTYSCAYLLSDYGEYNEYDSYLTGLEGTYTAYVIEF